MRLVCRAFRDTSDASTTAATLVTTGQTHDALFPHCLSLLELRLLPNLRALHLTFYTNVPGDIVMAGLRPLKNTLELLHLGSVVFEGWCSPEDSLAIFAPKLKTLRLPACHFDDNHMYYIVNVKWRNLTELDLKGCCFDEDEETVVVEYFIEQCPYLKTLRYSAPYSDLGKFFGLSLPLLEVCDFNDSENGGWMIGFEEIVEGAGANWPSLKELHLSGCNLDDEGLIALTKEHFPLLEHLDITHETKEEMDIGVDYEYGIEALEALRVAMETQWKQLKRVVVGMNDYGKTVSTLLDGTVIFHNLLEIDVGGEVCDSIVPLTNAARAGRLPAYEKLNIHVTEDTGEEVGELLFTPWPSLVSLHLAAIAWVPPSLTEKFISSVTLGNFPLLRELVVDGSFNSCILKLMDTFEGPLFPVLELLSVETRYYVSRLSTALTEKGPRLLPKLRELRLRGKSLTVKEATALRGAPWGELETMQVAVSININMSLGCVAFPFF